jgi:hypothetical protein
VHTERVQVNPQTRLVPIWALDSTDPPTFSDLLAQEIRVEPD